LKPALQIKVLGEFAVRRDGVDIPLPPSRKTRAVLAYLAVVGRPQRRERLCELFWGIPDDPRGALRWSLSKLRQILAVDGQLLLEADRNLVKLTAGAIDLDYDLIRDISPEAVNDLPTDQLEVIVAAFHGPFLADLYLSRCPEFEGWRTAYANATEVLRLKALRTLIGRLDGNPERALVYAHGLQSLLPDEDISAEIGRINANARLLAAARPGTDGRRVLPEAQEGGAPTTEQTEPGVARRQTVRFCHAPDGVRVAYAVSGTGPAIVRTAHWMSHLEFDWESPVWRHWMDALSDGFTLVRYDERLNGLSDHVADDISFEAFVADLECVVDAVGLERFVLLGVSQGCGVSVEYALRHPDKVAGLVLYGGYVRGWRARGDASEIARREAMTVLMREGWGQDDPTFRQLFTNLFIPDGDREQMDWFNELQRRTVTPENAYRLSHAFANIDVSEQIRRLRVPTLVLHARGDRLTPMAGSVEFAEQIAGARFVELDSSNHILLAGEPAFRRFVSETTSFATEVFASAPITSITSRAQREATLLCADFVSPLQAFSGLDPELALELVDPAMLKAAEVVREHGGTVLALSDTKLTASFGAHGTLPDHAARACRAALELHALVHAGHSAVRTRIALDTGVVIVAPPRIDGSGDVEVRGAPVSLVRQLNHALRRDVVATTERTRLAVGAAVRMQALASHLVSGFSRGQRLFEVLGLEQDPS
jgi:pimeloyl-ACP methyl ester carboxylesterase